MYTLFFMAGIRDRHGILNSQPQCSEASGRSDHVFFVMMVIHPSFAYGNEAAAGSFGIYLKWNRMDTKCKPQHQSPQLLLLLLFLVVVHQNR